MSSLSTLFTLSIWGSDSETWLWDGLSGALWTAECKQCICKAHLYVNPSEDRSGACCACMTSRRSYMSES